MGLVNKMDAFIIKMKFKIASSLENEKGDTNFISVLVLLGIALALAAIFLGFKDQILAWVDKNIGDFFTKSGGR